MTILFSITSLLAQIQSCNDTDQIFSETCCGSSDSRIADKDLFPIFSTRFAIKEQSTWTTTPDIDWSSETSVVADMLAMSISRRKANADEVTQLENKSLADMILHYGYDNSTLVKKDAADMAPGQNYTKGKFILVFGGGFAIEACMAFVRAGGHCYFGSRTQEKQDKIRQSIEALDQDKKWATAKAYTTVTADEASRIHWYVVDCRIEDDVLDHIIQTFAHASSNTTDSPLTPAGAFVAIGATKLPPVYKIASPTTVEKDRENHPTYLNNSNSFAHPDHYATHYFANLFIVMSFRYFFQNIYTNHPASSFNIVFTGSHVTLWDLAAWNDVKSTYNPLTGAAVDAEYTLAKKQTEYVRFAARAPFGSYQANTFKTGTVHPIGCHTEWAVTSLALSNWWTIFYGMTSETSLEEAGKQGRILSPMSVTDNIIPMTYENVKSGYDNLTSYWESDEGKSIRNQQFGGTPAVNVAQLILGSFAEAFCVGNLSINGTREECMGLVLTSLSTNSSYQFPYTNLPRAARMNGDKYETNYFPFLTFLTFLANTPNPLNPTITLLPENVKPSYQDLLKSCTDQFEPFEPFCTLSGREIMRMNSIFPAVGAVIGLKISPVVPPFVVGFEAARQIAIGTDQIHAYQYGMAGSFLSDTSIGAKFWGTIPIGGGMFFPLKDPFKNEYFASGDDNQDDDLLSLLLDASSSMVLSRRYVANSTFTYARWC